MVDKRKMKRVMKQINHKVTPTAMIGKEPLVLPNYSGMKKFIDEGHKLDLKDYPISFTDGSLVFAENNKLAQDNSDLFWDNVDKQLGVGTNTIIPHGTFPNDPFLDVNGAMRLSQRDRTNNGELFLGSTSNVSVRHLNGDNILRFRGVSGAVFEYFSGGWKDAVSWDYNSFDVNPEEHDRDFTVGWDSGQAFFIDGATGNVGINTPTPSSKLEIGGSISLPISEKTTNYTLTISDYTILLDGTSSTVTATLPAASGITGRIYNIKCIDATNQCDVNPNASEEIDGDSANFILNKDEVITIQSDGSNWWII